ncbi:MAG: NnrS family protein [Gammaproteobacteria bacterium]|jgi:uncharacterized protein involved in response to NO
MSLLNIQERDKGPVAQFALFELGFRPFFLLAGIMAVILVSYWILAYASDQSAMSYYDPVMWHSHEMIFGYTVAVISGFLLTAVRNWTGEQTARGYTLLALVLLWLAGRVLPFISAFIPAWLVAVVDVAFLPALAVALTFPLVRSGQTHNLLLLIIVAALTVANVMIHLQILGYVNSAAGSGIYSAVYLVVLLIVILGGRVIPFFTERGVRGAVTRRHVAIEFLSPLSVIVMIVLDLMSADPAAIIMAAGLSAVVNGIRLFGWYNAGIWSVPLLWVLHLGYAWIIAGFVLKALSAAGVVSPMLAVHAFTTAGIGSMTLGMMARVSLGHTGRTLEIEPAMTMAFILINLAGFSRVFAPVLIPEWYNGFVVLAGFLWVTAFITFVGAYTRVLIKPRIDGLAG